MGGGEGWDDLVCGCFVDRDALFPSTVWMNWFERRAGPRSRSEGMRYQLGRSSYI